VRLAIDDFGTGYSCLAYLAQFPVDILKIDRSFVVAMAGSSQAATLTEAVVRLAEFMHLQVIAEGIETSEQLQHVPRPELPLRTGLRPGPAHPRPPVPHTPPPAPEPHP